MFYNDNSEKVKQDWFWVQTDSGKWSQMLFQGWGTNNAVSLTEIAIEGGREVHLLPFFLYYLSTGHSIVWNAKWVEKNKEHATKTKYNTMHLVVNH